MKRFSKILCIFLVLLTMLSSLTVAINGASVFDRRQKSIYLVLDDSGSMDYEKMNDANYSLQTLLAMTDKNDLVKLYFLNEITGFGLSGKLDMSKKSNGWLSNICNKYPQSTGGTPYDKVMVAQRELTDAVSKDDNTEYWLVVFTDGDFAMSTATTPDQDLQNFANTTLANGSKPNVLYITVGGSVLDTGGLANLHAISGTSIIESMNDAAKIISGRIDLSDVSYSADSKEITFNLPYPAKNIIVFTQNNETKITGQKATSELDLSENYTVTYPGGAKLGKSTVCFLTEKNGKSIASGEITLTFDKALVPENTTVLFEPAIGMMARYYNADGQEIDPSKLYIGEEFKVEFTICDSETNQPLDPAIFGGNISYASEINGVRQDGANSRTFTIDGKDLDIKLYATLPDGYVLEETKKYEILEKRVVTFTLSNGGKFSADIRDLDKAEGINANILINGTPVTQKELDSFKIDISGTNKFISDFKIEKDTKNCNFVIHPKKGIISPLTPRNKTYQVTLTDTLRGDKYTADLVVEITGPRNWLPVILFILGLILAIYLIIVFATKTYFPRNLRFTLYVHKPNSGVKGKHGITYTLRQLYWKEFIRGYKGDFFKHLLNFFLINTQEQVTLYGIGSKDYYKDITIIARSSTSVSAADKSMKLVASTKKYRSDYEVYNASMIKILGAEHLPQVPDKKEKPRYTLDVGNVLVRKNVPPSKSRVYLHITQKNKKKNK